MDKYDPEEKDSLLRSIVNSQDPDYVGIKQRQIEKKVQTVEEEEVKKQNSIEQYKNNAHPPQDWWSSFIVHLKLITLDLQAFGYGLQGVAMFSVLMPIQVREAVGEREKGVALGVALIAGSSVSLLLPPLMGAWSDWVGKRIPFLLLGTIINLAGLLGLGFCTNISQIAGVTALVMFGASTYATAFGAALPDQVSKEKYGTTSGILGALSIAGGISGAGLGALIPTVGVAGAYCIIAGVSTICGLVTCCSIQEYSRPIEAPFSSIEIKTSRFSLKPLTTLFHRDFTLVCFSRFFVNLGIFTINEFLFWWVRDVLPIRGYAPSSEAPLLFIPAAITALISAVVVGEWSDRIRKRRIFLVTACLGMGGLAIALAFVKVFPVAAFLFSFFGLFMGSFLALEMAIIFDVLTNHDNIARDLGIFHVFVVLPQLFAAPVAGAILDQVNRYGAMNGQSHLGFVVIFCMAGSYFLVAALLFSCLRISSF